MKCPEKLGRFTVLIINENFDQYFSVLNGFSEFIASGFCSSHFEIHENTRRDKV